MPRIFISYRRQDSSNMTGRIHDRLVREFGDRNVFRDVYDIPAGSDFRAILNKEVSQCNIFLAIIGPQWVDVTDSQGNRRLDNPNDFVRIEVESALKNPRTLVIPVLVKNANMPVEEDLPESLRDLCYRNAVKVRTDPDFPRDSEMLTNQIKTYKSPTKKLMRWGVLALAMILIAGIYFTSVNNNLISEIPPFIQEFFSTSEQQMENPTIAKDIATLTPLVEADELDQIEENPTPFEDTTTPTPLVEPVYPGQIMVLVAQIEQIGSQERNVTRFIVDDLRQRFEVEIPFTNVIIREYKDVITSRSQALEIAEKTQAEIVIWGHYDDSVTVNIQLGSLESHSGLVFEREFLDRIINVRVKMTNERQETLANIVGSSISILYNAENENLKQLLLVMALDMLNAPNPEMIDNSNATHVHNAMTAFFSEQQEALDEYNLALERDASNPILYSFRGALHQRMGDFDLGDQDLNTAITLGPEDWMVPYVLKGSRSLIEINPTAGIESYTKALEIRSDDWFPYNMRGYFYFLAHEYELARADIEKSIELGPEAEYPYMWATLIALRQGRLTDASEMLSSLLNEKPDPVFVERFMTALYGEDYAILLGNSMAAMGHLALGQYNAVLQNTEVVLSIVPEYPEMHLLNGLSYCNLEDYANAEIAYTDGLKLDPSFTVLYLLRSEMRGKLGDMAGAGEDLATVQQSDLAEELEPYLVAAESGEFSCKQFIPTK